MKRLSLVVTFFAIVTVAGCGGGRTAVTSIKGGGGGPVAASVRDTVPVDTHPTSVTVDPATNSIYVVNNPDYCAYALGGLTTIDGSTDSNAGESFPFERLEVASFLNCSAYKIDCFTTSQPVAIKVDSTTKTGYTFLAGVICVSDHAVLTYSYVAATDMATAGYPVSGTLAMWETDSCGPFVGITAPSPGMMALNTETNKVYATWPLCNQVVDFAAQSVSTVDNPGYPIALAVNSTTNKIYVANLDGNNVTVIDGASDSVLTTITDPNAVSPAAVAVNPATNTIYVANSQTNNVTVIDGASDSVVTMIPVGNAPSGLDVDSQTNFVYVANAGNSPAADPGNVTVINGRTNATTTLSDPNAKNPIAIAVNPVTNKIYVANFGSNNVTVIDGAHD